MPEVDQELQTRTCRACGDDYRYPVLRSQATRFYCETCTELPPVVRSTLEKQNKRIRVLNRRIEKLEARLSGQSGTESKES